MQSSPKKLICVKFGVIKNQVSTEKHPSYLSEEWGALSLKSWHGVLWIQNPLALLTLKALCTFIAGNILFFIPHHMIVAGYYCIILVVHVFANSVCSSMRLSYIRLQYFHFQVITWVNVNGFSPNFVCAIILLRSGLGLLMGKFRQFWTVNCPRYNNGGMLSFHIFIYKFF